MATATNIPLSEYLTTSYEHDPEWVDGELRERGMPDEYHSAIQMFFIAYFERLRRELHVRVRPELRLRVAEDRYRIPDVALLREAAPFTRVAKEAPVLCIEVLSPDDRASDLQEKIADYLAMGVAAIWVIDPRRRTMATADVSGTHYVAELVLDGTTVRISGGDLFSEIDELEGRDR